MEEYKMLKNVSKWVLIIEASDYTFRFGGETQIEAIEKAHRFVLDHPIANYSWRLFKRR